MRLTQAMRPNISQPFFHTVREDRGGSQGRRVGDLRADGRRPKDPERGPAAADGRPALQPQKGENT